MRIYFFCMGIVAILLGCKNQNQSVGARTRNTNNNSTKYTAPCESLRALSSRLPNTYLMAMGTGTWMSTVEVQDFQSKVFSCLVETYGFRMLFLDTSLGSSLLADKFLVSGAPAPTDNTFKSFGFPWDQNSVQKLAALVYQFNQKPENATNPVLFFGVDPAQYDPDQIKAIEQYGKGYSAELQSNLKGFVDGVLALISQPSQTAGAINTEQQNKVLAQQQTILQQIDKEAQATSQQSSGVQLFKLLITSMGAGLNTGFNAKTSYQLETIKSIMTLKPDVMNLKSMEKALYISTNTQVSKKDLVPVTGGMANLGSQLSDYFRDRYTVIQVDAKPPFSLVGLDNSLTPPQYRTCSINIAPVPNALQTWAQEQPGMYASLVATQNINASQALGATQESALPSIMSGPLSSFEQVQNDVCTPGQQQAFLPISRIPKETADGIFILRSPAALSSTTTVPVPGSQNSATSATVPSFTDVTTDTAFAQEIQRAASLGFVAGFPDRTFRPNEPLSREQMAAIMAQFYIKTFEPNAIIPMATGVSFSDVKNGNWSTKYIEFVKNKGIFVGFENKTFQPKTTLTRAQLISVLVNATQKGGIKIPPPKSPLPFDDNEFKVPYWATNNIALLAKSQTQDTYCPVAIPLTGSSFKPNSPASRGYTAFTLVTLYDCIKPNSNTTPPPTNP